MLSKLFEDIGELLIMGQEITMWSHVFFKEGKEESQSWANSIGNAIFKEQKKE